MSTPPRDAGPPPTDLELILRYQRLARLPHLERRDVALAHRLAGLEEDLAAAPGDARRSWRRVPLVLAGEVRTPLGSIPFELQDASAHGLCIRGVLPPHERVELFVTGRDQIVYRFRCEVVWTCPSRGEAGVRLDGVPARVGVAGLA